MADVRTATRADRAALLDALTEAFALDPVVSWMIGSAPTPPRRARRFFAALTGHALRHGWCDLAVDDDGHALGAAVWYPPGGLPTGLQSLAQLPGLTLGVGPRLGTVGRADRRMAAHRPDEPHWYLQFAGVRPDSTGAGVGGALLRNRLARIDAPEPGDPATTPLPAFLESSNPRNVSLYRRLGFEVADELRIDPDGPTETLMLRPAGGLGCLPEASSPGRVH